MNRVVFIPEVRQYSQSLMPILYEKDGELLYQVRYITNNHKDAQHLDLILSS